MESVSDVDQGGDKWWIIKEAIGTVKSMDYGDHYCDPVCGWWLYSCTLSVGKISPYYIGNGQLGGVWSTFVSYQLVVQC